MPFLLDQTEVYVGGLQSPLISVDSGHVFAVVPFHAEGRGQLTIEVRTNGVSSNTLNVTENAAAPEILDQPPDGLSNDGYEAIYAAGVNQDGTINSADHPAGGGEMISIFVVGAGAFTPLPDEGTPGTSSQKLALPVTVVASRNTYPLGFAGTADVVYAGAAPGLVGVAQIVLRLPPAPSAVKPAWISVSIGDQMTRALVWVGGQ